MADTGRAGWFKGFAVLFGLLRSSDDDGPPPVGLWRDGASPSAAAPTTAPSPTPPPVISLSATGDIIFGDASSLPPADGDGFFDGVAEALRADLVMGNLEQPLTEDTVHRAAEVMALTGLAEGDPVTVEAVTAVLTHPAGGLKGVPPGAMVWVVATKFSTALAPAAGELGVQVLDAAPVAGVVFLPPAPVAALAVTPFAHMRADSEQ